MIQAWLEPGKVYRNRCGDDYLCKAAKEDSSAVLERLSDRWTLVAHGVGLYPDGTIEWDYSTGGFWPDRGQKETPAPQEVTRGPARDINFCIARYINAFFEQFHAGEVADWGRACDGCPRFDRKWCCSARSTIAIVDFCWSHGVEMRLNKPCPKEKAGR